MPHYSFKSPFLSRYEHVSCPSDLTVVYTHGFCSDPWGTKAEHVKAHCINNNVSFFRYELAGHGSDAANYMASDFNVWKNQLLDIIDNRVSGKIILVGSSLGGWLSLIGARDRGNRVSGVLGLAAAPDFTADIMHYVLTPAQRAQLDTGTLIFPTNEFTYTATKRIFDTASENLVLTGALNITCPVHIIHGTADKTLIPEKPFQIQRALTSDNVVVKLIKGAGHRLDSEIDRGEIRASLSELFRLARGTTTR